MLHREKFPRANGLGTFMLTEYVPTSERTSDRYPFLLTTGRILTQYNVGTQTRRTPNSLWHPEDLLEINEQDAVASGVRDGDWVKMSSKFGQIELRARISERVNPGIVYTTFHHAKSKANAVTSDLSDWATNCPEYKVTAVDVVRINAPTEDASLDAERLEPAE